MEALERLSPDSSRSTLRSWLKNERVRVDGELIKKEKDLLESGQELTIEKKREALEYGVRVLFEDRHLIVVDKPEGLLSVATDFQTHHTLHAVLKRRLPRLQVYPVHRLDRETSGVIVFAYTETAKEGLKKQFATHQIIRKYQGLVEGGLTKEEGTWESNLFDDANYVVKSTTKGGKRAVTHFKVTEQRGKCTLVGFKLETGRKNQIRVHCSEAGHPIAGDKKYGAQSNPFKRLCLHAVFLEFDHPVTGKKLSFTSYLNPSFSQ